MMTSTGNLCFVNLLKRMGLKDSSFVPEDMEEFFK
jgi:hypothetical protein